MIIALLIFCAAIATITVALVIVGVSVYDIASIRYARSQNDKKHRRRIALIVRYKTEADIARILRMAALPYKNLLVIVINQTGKSNVKRRLKADNKRLLVFSNRQAFMDAALHACKKYNHNKGLAVVIGKDSEIDEVSLYEMIAYMSDRNPPKSALLNRFYCTHFNVGGLISTYIQSLVQLRNKTRSVLGLPTYITDLDTVIYKDLTYINQRTSVGFIASSTAFVEFNGSIWNVFIRQIQATITTWLNSRRIMFANGKTIRAWIDWLFYVTRQFALFAFIVPFGYVVYIAFSLHQPVLLFISIGMVTLFFIYALWSDNQLDTRYRITLLAQLPIVYVLLPFWVTLPIIAVIIFILEMLANMVEAKFPRRIGFFTRIKDILRIV